MRYRFEKFTGSVGDCFFFQDINSSVLHLTIVCTEALETKESQVVIVNITTNPIDQTIALYPKDHPYIVNDSFVAYSFAKLRKLSQIQFAINAGKLQAHDPIEDKDLMLEIQEGFLESEYTPLEIKEIMREYLKSKTSL